MHGRLFVDGWDAHEAGDWQAVGFARFLDERIGFERRHTGFLWLTAGVHLHQKLRTAAVLLRGISQGGGELRAIEAVDGVEERDGVLGLVRLQRADETQAKIGRLCTARGPARLRFLNAVLAEQALARSQHGVDALVRLLL